MQAFRRRHSRKNIYDVHSDHLDTPKMLTDDTGAVAWRAAHEVFGKTALDAGNDVTFNIRFPGQYYDAESGLHYNRHRYYAPDVGRYVSADPIGQVAGTNLFTYAALNPLAAFDPLGLDNSSPWRVGWDWLTGTGPRTRTFTNDDPFTNLLKQHPHIGALQQGVCSGSLPPQGSFPYYLGGLAGVPKYVADYSTLATGGLTGNLAVTYLGSYGLTYSSSNGTINVHVTNTSSIASATHPPVIGYTPWWDKNVGKPLNSFFSSGPMSATTQKFNFQVNCGCQ